MIGAPDTQTYPLMQAINQNKSRTKIYGWFNGGFDVSSSNKGDGANSPAAYYYTPNKIIPISKSFTSSVSPIPYRQSISTGASVSLSSTVRITATPPPRASFQTSCWVNNHEFGYDPVMYYVDLYFPHVAKGMNVRVGRYISLPDIEA